MPIVEVLSKNFPAGSESSVRNRIKDDVAIVVLELEDIDFGRYISRRGRHLEAGEGISEGVISG